MIKNHAHAIEVLNSCLPHFNTTSFIDFSNPDQLIFKWSNKKYLLYLTSGSVFEVRGHTHDLTDCSMLMQALIKKTVYPESTTINK